MRHSARSTKDIRREWAELERRRKGHSTVRPDMPYDVPSYYSEKDRRRGKQHPGHMLLEERGYGPMDRGPLTLKHYGQLGAHSAARRPGRDPNTRAEPPSPSRSSSRMPGARGTRVGGSGTLATPRPCARAGASNAKSTSQRPRAPSHPISQLGRSCPRRSRRHPPCAAGPSGPAPARDSTLQAEYKAAHRMVPYEHRQVAEPAKPLPGYGPQRRGPKDKLRWLAHESAAGPRVTGSDRAIVPAGLSYSEREKQGREDRKSVV